MKIAKILLYIFLLLVLSSTLVYAQTVTINPSNPVDNDDLSCDIENVQNSNRPFYTYRWYVNGQRDYSVGNTWIYPASRTRVNDRITCFASIPGGIILGSASVTISAVQVNQPPTVRITNPSIGSRFFVNQPITFNTVTSDPENDPLTFTWDFGDGSASGGANPIHTYTLPGTYTVTVVVSDNVNTARDSVVINIVQIMPMNQIPVADLRANNINPNVGDLVTFDASNSRDPDGNIVRYSFNFGDGNVVVTTNPIITHVYGSTGVYGATVVVTDDDGATATTLPLIITVNVPGNQLPIADAGPDRNVQVGDLVTFDASNSRDPDGNIVSYGWNFGDGNTASSITSTNVYSNPGTYTVTLTVVDNNGGIDTDTAIVIVSARPANMTGINAVLDVNSRIGYVGFPLYFDASRSTSNNTIVNYAWNFGDGNTSNSINVRHAYNAIGNYTVTLTVTDNTGASDTDSVVIEVRSVLEKLGPDYDKQRTRPYIHDLEFNDFRITKVVPLNFKPYYRKGERVTFIVKLTNEGALNEQVDLKLSVPKWSIVNIVRNIYLDLSQVKLVTITLDIPNNAQPGLHLVRFDIASDFGESDDNAFWPVIVV